MADQADALLELAGSPRVWVHASDPPVCNTSSQAPHTVSGKTMLPATPPCHPGMLARPITGRHLRRFQAMPVEEFHILQESLCGAVRDHSSPIQNDSAWQQFVHQAYVVSSHNHGLRQ